MKLEHSLMIEAPVDVVWGLTERIEDWPTMTPTMTSVRRLGDGPVGVGTQAIVKQPAQRAAVWTVDVFEPCDRFVWSTRTLGLRIVGSHALAATPEGCRNTLGVDVEGRGSRLFAAVFGSQIRKAIATENQGFKRVAERAVSAG